MGKLNGVIPATGPSRKAANDAPASGSEFLPVQGKELAVDASAFFGGDLKGESGAFDFDARGFDGLAGFLGEGAGKFLLALRHGGDDLAQNALALERGKSAGGAESFNGRGDGSLGVLFTALHDASDQAVVVGSSNLDEIAILVPTAIHKKAVRRNRRDRHLGHDFFEAPIDPTFGIIGLWMQRLLQGMRKHLVRQRTQQQPGKTVHLYNGSLTMGIAFCLSIAELAPRLRRGEISPVEITRECLQRIEKLNPALNAFITVMAESALAEARTAEAEIARGSGADRCMEFRSRLKDLIDTAGVRTTAGARCTRTEFRPQDADVVRRLRQSRRSDHREKQSARVRIRRKFDGQSFWRGSQSVG